MIDKGVSMEWIDIFNWTIAILFNVCYLYQIFYLIVGCVKKPLEYPEAPKTKRYAVMIAARNEEAVIGQLCDSIRKQDYPRELIDIFVAADNCTDKTKEVAESHGATVYERFNKELRGKGYALEFLFDCVRADHGEDYYDGFFIFDADNLLDEHYVTEMNKCMCAGNPVVAAYRNSKNYGDNWISAGYSLWFLREARHLNHPRSRLHTSCAVSGTGFLVGKEVVNRQGGWKHFLLTEDIEFSTDCALHGDRIGYCHKAMFYDEQPTKFSQSWRQRSRWAKGFFQVIRNYGGKLVKGLFQGKGFACFDMLMMLAPAFILTTLGLFVNVGVLIYSAIFARMSFVDLALGFGKIFLDCYLYMFAVGLISGIFEWKKIRASTVKKILYFFTFPLFMLTYLPIAISALFTKVEWRPIEHKVSLSLEEVESKNTGKKIKSKEEKKVYHGKKHYAVK